MPHVVRTLNPGNELFCNCCGAGNLAVIIIIKKIWLVKKFLSNDIQPIQNFVDSQMIWIKGVKIIPIVRDHINAAAVGDI